MVLLVQRSGVKLSMTNSTLASPQGLEAVNTSGSGFGSPQLTFWIGKGSLSKVGGERSGSTLKVLVRTVPVSYTHLTLPTIYSV